MKIMVFDVPASSGGALKILNQYYDMACNDRDNEWIFVVSKPELLETENVKILRFPWIKKSWAHRILFDRVYSSKLVNTYKPDKIISLQNTTVKAPGCFQELYIHQALPFCEKRFSFFDNKKLWIYQNIISKKIIKSARIADSVVVQTSWMRDSICKKAGIKNDKIKIVQPTVSIPDGAQYKQGPELLFFYPANGAVYKNHSVIYKAVRKLKTAGYTNFKVVLTINKGDEFSANYNDIAELIDFCGHLDKKCVDEFYRKSILLFPSYIESFGLPLLEARLYGCPIIASDCSFSREILDGYEMANFFSPFAENELFSLMEYFCKTSPEVTEK